MTRSNAADAAIIVAAWLAAAGILLFHTHPEPLNGAALLALASAMLLRAGDVPPKQEAPSMREMDAPRPLSAPPPHNYVVVPSPVQLTTTGAVTTNINVPVAASPTPVVQAESATMTTLQTIEAGALGTIIGLANANSAAIEAYIASGEADITLGLKNLIKNIPTVKGALALVATPIEDAIESALTSYVGSIIAKETPATLFALVISYLTSLQTAAEKA